MPLALNFTLAKMKGKCIYYNFQISMRFAVKTKIENVRYGPEETLSRHHLKIIANQNMSELRGHN